MDELTNEVSFIPLLPVAIVMPSINEEPILQLSLFLCVALNLNASGMDEW